MSCCNKYSFPPGPPKLPLIGNMHNVDIKDLHNSLWDHRDKFGDLSMIRLAGMNIVVLNSMAAVRKLYQSAEYGYILVDRPNTFIVNHILSNGISVEHYSEQWMELKCVAKDAIKPTIQDSQSITAAQNDEFKHLKNALCDEKGRAFDPRDILASSVFNTVMMSLVCRRFDYDHEIFTHIGEYDNNGNHLFTAKGRMAMNMCPGLRNCGCGYGEYFSNMMQHKAAIIKYLLYDIKEEIRVRGREDSIHVADNSPLSNQKIPKKDGVVYKLIEAQKTHPRIEDKNIEGVILDWYIAGVVTTRVSLFSLLYQLLHHPHVQEKIHEEIVKVLDTNGIAKVGDQERMPYTKAVVYESLRLTAAVPGGVPRCNISDIAVDDYRLPKGTLFMLNVWRIHHDEEIWKEPWSFKPERFLDHNGHLLPADHPKMEAVLSNGTGYRECIGKEYMISRLFLYVVNICQSFEVYNEGLQPDSWLDPRHYIRDTLLYAPVYEIQLRERGGSVGGGVGGGEGGGVGGVGGDTASGLVCEGNIDGGIGGGVGGGDTARDHVGKGNINGGDVGGGDVGSSDVSGSHHADGDVGTITLIQQDAENGLCNVEI